MADLAYEIDVAFTDFLDKLYDIERDRGIDHGVFVRELSTHIGYDVSDPYQDWYDEND